MKRIDIFISIFIFIASFLLFSVFKQLTINGDAVSMYYPAKNLIQHKSLNDWNTLNDQYATYYFKLPFTDTIIYKDRHSYPMQTPFVIFTSYFFLRFFGDMGFFLMPCIFGAFSASIFYLLSKKLTQSRHISVISTLLFISLPICFLWSTIPNNISMSVSFLLLSLYCFIEYVDTKKVLLLFISSLSLMICAFFRIPHIFFYAPFLYLLAFKVEKDKIARNIIIFLLPIILMSGLFIVVNQSLFNDLFFIGYLKVNYHPNPTSCTQESFMVAGHYLFEDFHFSTVFDSIKKFMLGSSLAYFPIIFFSFLALLYRNGKAISLITTFTIISLFIYLFYYGYQEPLFWFDPRPEYTWTLQLVYFRYLLPIYMLLNLCFSSFLLYLFRHFSSKLRLITSFLLLMFILSSIYTTYKFKFGGSLEYGLEINNKIHDFSRRLLPVLEKDSVILYDTRWPLAYTYPNTNDFNWFYYDGIPPACRQEHTLDIVNKLLLDGRTVYFVGQEEPYNQTSQNIEDALREHFSFKEVHDSDFPRMKTIFYKLSLPFSEIK